MLCRLIGHRRSHRVWHDGLDSRASCRRCRAAMIRDRQGWRAYDPALDGDADRLSKEEALRRAAPRRTAPVA